jgi:hypothetical protein
MRGPTSGATCGPAADAAAALGLYETRPSNDVGVGVGCDRGLPLPWACVAVLADDDPEELAAGRRIEALARLRELVAGTEA